MKYKHKKKSLDTKLIANSFQGALRNGKAPDGTSYLDAAEKPEIKALLTA